MKNQNQLITSFYKGKGKKGFLRPLALSFFMLASIDASAQVGKVSLDINNVSVKEFFSAIEKQTSYHFSYRDIEIQDKEAVTVSSKDEEIKKLLVRELSQRNLTYRVSGNKIIVTPVKQESGKRITVKGIVKDANGEALVGVTIRLESDKTIGAISDFEGNFMLPDVPKGDKLLVSYIGYKDQTILAQDNIVVNVVLKEDTQTLEEVVVVGYGTQKKINLTGAVESVSSETLENRPIKSATDALQGAVSGLTVTSGTGQPGEFASFKIRGNTSINSAGALVIIDGLPGDINLVNPQDIESISVLKDAASAAIYGARAAEGVVLVTTRAGKSEKVKVEYSGNFSFNKPTRLPKSNTGLNHALLSNEAFKNAGLAV